MKKNKAIEINGTVISPGERKRIELPVAQLFDYTKMVIPVKVVSGRFAGPTLFVSGAIHGDELNGVEICKRLLAKKHFLSQIHGTLVVVPVVNMFGFNQNSRYLPDRRDLNRCFPGSEEGSLGAQIAHKFMHEIVLKCDYGIDIHTAGGHRNNLPQVRGSLDNKVTLNLAKKFGAPVILNSSVRDGSLRGAAADNGIPTLLYEGGEALRHNEHVIKLGLDGIIHVMAEIGMIPENTNFTIPDIKEPFMAQASHWLRAPHSGSLRIRKGLGHITQKGELLGVLSDPYGDNKKMIYSKKDGIIIGVTNLPLVNKGDACFHVATFERNINEETIDLFDPVLRV